MISLLETIASTIAQIGALFLYGLVEGLNALFAALGALFAASVSLLGELPEVPSPPGFVEALNWLLPIGSVVPVALTLLTGYIAFISLRWLFKKVGAA